MSNSQLTALGWFLAAWAFIGGYGAMYLSDKREKAGHDDSDVGPFTLAAFLFLMGPFGWIPLTLMVPMLFVEIACFAVSLLETVPHVAGRVFTIKNWRRFNTPEWVDSDE